MEISPQIWLRTGSASYRRVGTLDTNLDDTKIVLSA